MKTKGKKWKVAYHDQGMGHGLYGIINDKKEVMVENINHDDAKDICKAFNSHERLVDLVKTASGILMGKFHKDAENLLKKLEVN